MTILYLAGAKNTDTFLLHLFTIKEKRCAKHLRSLASSSSFSSMGNASTPPPSSSPLPLGSPPEISSRWPSSPVREHGGPSEEIPVVDLSFNKDKGLPDTS
jgi:hypothetical protein